jgi:hypothetical protein
MKTRILKNGKGQFVVEILHGFLNQSWHRLVYYRSIKSFALTRDLVPHNGTGIQLFGTEEEARQTLADYIDTVTFTEV